MKNFRIAFMIVAALVIHMSARAQSFTVTDLHGTWTGTDQHGTSVVLTFNTDYTVALTLGVKGLPVTTYRVPQSTGSAVPGSVARGILIGTNLPVPNISLNSDNNNNTVGISTNYPYGNLVYICNATMNASMDELTLEIDLNDGYIDNNSGASGVSTFVVTK